MVMQMRNGLARVRPIVHDDPKTALLQLFLRHNIPNHSMDLAQELQVAIVEMHDRLDVLFRNDKHVRGRSGMHIPERDHVFGFMDDGRGNFLRYNPAKKTPVHKE